MIFNAKRPIATALLMAMTALPILSSAEAKPLSDSACVFLIEEYVALRKDGVALDIAEGPEGARDRLSPARLSQIKRYLDIDAQITFRCPGFSLTGPGAPHNVPVRNPKPMTARLAVDAAVTQRAASVTSIPRRPRVRALPPPTRNPRRG